MADDIYFEANDRIIKDALFQKYVFKIPRYQRPYAWTEDEVAELWNDVNEENGALFIGSFIFNHETLENDGYLEVVDGQQRILTITILIAAIRDAAYQIESGLSDYFQRQMIVIEKSYKNWSPRIICGDSTRPFFEKYIQVPNSEILESNPNSPEEKLIKSNYKYFLGKIRAALDTIETNEKRKDYLNKLIIKIENIIVIYIKIAREEDAYEIFETTNARGVELNVADLLKNWIFKNIKVDGVKDLAKEIWQDIETNVQGDLRRFLRYHWISKNNFVTERKLYKTIKSKITKWDEFLDELWKSSDLYNMLIHPSEEQWMAASFKNNTKLYKSVAALKLMNVTQCHVLLLCILRNYSKLGMDPKRIFELIEKFSFVYSVVSKQPGNKVEKLYNNYAIKLENILNNEDVNENTRVKVETLFNQFESDLRSNKPTEDFFKKAFADLKYKNNEGGRVLIKYVLSEINNYYEKTKEHKIDFNNVNVEHIIPQTPDPSWGLSKSDIKEYVNCLGNLTLVDRVINSRAGNKSLSEKLDLLRDSQLPITRNLIKEIEENGINWNEGLILERQEKMATLAYREFWKF